MHAESLNVLLIQMRKDPAMLLPERAGFLRFSGLAAHQVDSLDVFRSPHFSPQILSAYDMLWVGGLSDDPSDRVGLSAADFPFLPALTELIHYAIDSRLPALLSCGGFMIASQILGAEVAIAPQHAELGIYDIHLTQEALTDPLFAGFPTPFKGVCGHIKSTLRLPEDCVRLMYSARCPIHAFKVKHAPFYAFQFHPEIACEELEARVSAYKGKYFASEEAYQAFIHLMDNTDTANSILRRFVDWVQGGRGENNLDASQTPINRSA